MNKLMKSERQRKILEIVQEAGSKTVADLCEIFDVTDMTIRRDLREMDREGLLRRVHGGIVANLGRSYEPAYTIRSTQYLENKIKIGQKASDLIINGDSIALDVGTTTLEIAKALNGNHNLTIITASLNIANEIVGNFSLENDMRLILTGGIVRPGELSLIGHIAEMAYKDFHVDKAFIGVGGISVKDGLTEYNLEDALVKKYLIHNANKCIVVADSSKIGRATFASFADISVVDTLITDSDVPKDYIKAFEELNIEVLIA